MCPKSNAMAELQNKAGGCKIGRSSLKWPELQKTLAVLSVHDWQEDIWAPCNCIYFINIPASFNGITIRLIYFRLMNLSFSQAS